MGIHQKSLWPPSNLGASRDPKIQEKAKRKERKKKGEGCFSVGRKRKTEGRSALSLGLSQVAALEGWPCQTLGKIFCHPSLLCLLVFMHGVILQSHTFLRDHGLIKVIVKVSFFLFYGGNRVGLIPSQALYGYRECIREKNLLPVQPL